MSHLKPIYAVWNHNAEAMAADIGQSGGTVRQWRNRESIPSDYWPAIIEAARKLGKTVHWKQFSRPSSPVLCALCERRTNDPAVNGCTEVDCPHSEQAVA
ncbi:MAG: hypothetical protein ABJP02_05030 [Parasphingorhabdus sp.]|uniref:carph-isopro domain-containing protein n=1 Tax=Parasphingorhabdus sp. TaxID=2709688 RepID=UPI00329A3633